MPNAPESPQRRSLRDRILPHPIRSFLSTSATTVRKEPEPDGKNDFDGLMPRRQWMRDAAVMATAGLLVGCTRRQTFESVTLPARHSIQMDNLLVLSEFKLPRHHPLVEDLKTTRQAVLETLELPPQRDEVVVYLFSGQEEYQDYLQTTFPTLPHRRAYFVGTPHELSVYTYWGDRIQEDLRHEYTHGILHSSLGKVPLWLDEGLAEYFEVSGSQPGSINADHAAQLTNAMQNGWKPDIDRLESLADFAQMQKIDYQESWVWVHYLLHDSQDSRAVLVDYMAAIKDTREPPSLASRIRDLSPSIEQRFIAYLANLQTAQVLAQSPDTGS